MGEKFTPVEPVQGYEQYILPTIEELLSSLPVVDVPIYDSHFFGLFRFDQVVGSRGYIVKE